MPRELGTLFLILVLSLPVLAGLYGIWSLLRSPVQQRSDRFGALGCSATVALAVSVLFGYVGHLLGTGMIVGYKSSLLEDLLVAVPFGALFGLAALGGWAFIARRSEGPVAFLGIVAGPVMLILLPIYVSQLIRGTGP